VGIAGQSLEFAENGTVLDEWIWKDLGVLELRAGPLPLTLSRAYGQDEQYSIFVDALAISADLTFDPAGQSLWEPVRTTDEIEAPRSDYTLTDGLPPAVYRWTVRIFDGSRLVDSHAARGVESLPASFVVTP
jgi:hypothetical protein